MKEYIKRKVGFGMEYPDIYFTDEYGLLYERNFEGKFTRFCSECSHGKVQYGFLLREIDIDGLKGWYDIITPYGYGGPLFSVCSSGSLKNLIQDFKEKFEAYCREKNIVSEFVRFHPLLQNHMLVENCMDVCFNRDTVYMDLSSPDSIWNNMQSECRNRIRKAEKNSITVEIDNSQNSLEKFMDLYYRTMEKNSAEAYYFFSRDFFCNMFDLLRGSIFIFNALHDKKVIAGVIAMKHKDFLNYHLSGADYRYIGLAPINMLFYKIALWGHRNGCRFFHLGGGYKGNNDSLFMFKKKFSKSGTARFYTGEKIHNESVYKELVEKWEESNKNSKNVKTDYFPLYRR